MKATRAVLGIDAAWTAKEPSGVALIVEHGSTWHTIAVSPSYQGFEALADGERSQEIRPRGSIPDASRLLSSAMMLCGRPVDLVAIDMPLARSQIVGRRVSDNKISRAYGARKCGTHSPSESRPGPISDTLREQFDRAGYPLLTDSIALPGLIEVYPHPALVHLASATERLRYKASKVRSYWPTSTVAERRTLLLAEWSRISQLLGTEIKDVAGKLPTAPHGARGFELKAYEDMLDAVVCAWVAICAVEGRAVAFGDHNSAIWVPAQSRSS